MRPLPNNCTVAVALKPLPYKLTRGSGFSIDSACRLLRQSCPHSSARCSRVAANVLSSNRSSQRQSMGAIAHVAAAVAIMRGLQRYHEVLSLSDMASIRACRFAPNNDLTRLEPEQSDSLSRYQRRSGGSCSGRSSSCSFASDPQPA